MADDALAPLTSQVHLISISQDPLVKLAELLVTDHCDSLPDLCHTTLLLPDLNSAARCRKLLLKQANGYGCKALLGPNIKTLQAWSIASATVQRTQLINDYARELILVEALLEHPDLYGQGSPWLLAKSLLELFDQLTRNFVKLPDTLDQFTKLLSKAYGINDKILASLSREAHIVYTLWQAMQEQLKSQQLYDRETVHSLGLKQLSLSLMPNNAIYMTGYTSFTRAEQDWVNKISKQLPLKIVMQGHRSNDAGIKIKNTECTTSIELFTHQLLEHIELPVNIARQTNAYSECIDCIFESNRGAFIDRSSEFLSRFKSSPIQENIRIYLAGSAEQEAQAIDLQIRIWLLAGFSNIAVVTENRKLARRVRAILERSNIHISDSAGWALSTTSASTTIERLLQVIEEDFHYQPLLDLLKSPFIYSDMDRHHLLETIYRFEQGIVTNENIASGMQRYLDSITFRKNKLEPTKTKYYDDIPPLLIALDKSVRKLKALLVNKHPPAIFIKTLLDTLESLGIKKSLNNDNAGNRIITEIQLMGDACQHARLTIDWLGFRVWLGETLEHYNFKPTENNCRVQLLSLSQSSLTKHDAVIVAGMEKEFLPGFRSNSPFFNDEVRASLGLDTQIKYQLERFLQFRQLLESTPGNVKNNSHYKILLSARKQEGDEEISASPWLEAIRSFHIQTYNDSLNATQLGQLLDSAIAETKISSPEPAEKHSSHPKVAVTKDLVPSTISASGYQQLLDCPYQFYAARCLKLSPKEEVQKFLAKSDYGERVHQCLLAFHQKQDHLPGPFPKRITESNKESAITLLEKIAQKVFSSDVEDNFIHRGWLKIWLNMIPRYIDWQIKHGNTWKPYKLEEKIEPIALSPHIKISGIIDRIDIDRNNLCVIDYKTGQIPNSTGILSGETIQLPFYALIADAQLGQKSSLETSEIHYLSLSHNIFGLKASLNKEDIANLKPQISQRLIDIFAEIYDGETLPAWGDNITCSRCNMDGVCRKQEWSSS